MTILYFILLLGVIICFHELGHFIAAKIFGVYVYEFSFGMGPKLFHKKGKETQFSIRALPVGGFVAMAGEKDGDEAYPDVVVPEGRRLTDAAPWKKIIIMLAGVFNNFVLAYLIFVVVLLMSGVITTSPKPVVASVAKDSPAEEAGFEAGDAILKVEKEDGSSVKPKTFLDLQSFNAGYSDELTYTVQRDDKTIELKVTPAYNEEAGAYLIGITAPQPESVKITVLNCWYYGGYEMTSMVRMMKTTLQGLFFHGSGLDQLSGPVGIYQATDTYASMGPAAFLFLVAELSLNVGIMNLLPLPVLDGGQVILTLIEWAFHKTLNEKVKAGIMIGCWVLLIGMMVLATWNDISRLLA